MRVIPAWRGVCPFCRARSERERYSEPRSPARPPALARLQYVLHAAVSIHLRARNRHENKMQRTRSEHSTAQHQKRKKRKSYLPYYSPCASKHGWGDLVAGISFPHAPNQVVTFHIHQQTQFVCIVSRGAVQTDQPWAGTMDRRKNHATFVIESSPEPGS